MRYCGIHVSADPGRQRLCTLHGRRGADGLELVASFYDTGSVEQVVRTVCGFGRGEALVGIGAPSRVGADRAELQRRGLPGRGEQSPTAIAAAQGLYEGLSELGRYRPQSVNGALSGLVDATALPFGRVFETDCEAVFCALLGHRAPPEATPWGGQQRISALRRKGVVDDDGGLWHRTLEELAAAAAAYAAYALSAGLGAWLGDPAEGVLVVPTAGLLDSYETLPPPARSGLA